MQITGRLLRPLPMRDQSMQTKQTRHVYKILDQVAAQRSERDGRVETALDVADGYVHLSTAVQLQGTLERYYTGSMEVLLLEYSINDIADRLKWEPSRNGDLFPHYYGTLQWALATRRWRLACSSNTPPLLPESIKP